MPFEQIVEQEVKSSFEPVEESPYVEMSKAPTEVKTSIDFNINKANENSKFIFSEGELESIKSKGPISFWESLDYLDYSQIAPGGGILQAVDAGLLLNASKKLEKGEELSVGEEEIIRNYVRKSTEMELRGITTMGKIGYYGAQVPAFMTEFVATAGVGKTAQMAASKAVGKIAKSSAVKAATGISANVLARTAVLPTMYTPTYGELRVNDYMAVTDKGSIIYKESKESPAKSALKAFGYTAAEVASELSGEAIGKFLIKPITKGIGKALKTPLTQAVTKLLPKDTQIALYNAYKSINPNATVSKVFSAAGFHGVLEELGEERISTVLKESLNLSLDKDMTFEDYVEAITPSKDQLLVEGGIISILGGTRASLNIASNLLMSEGKTKDEAKEILDNLSASEQEQLINDKLKIDDTVVNKNEAYLDKKMSEKYGENWKEIEEQNVSIDKNIILSEIIEKDRIESEIKDPIIDSQLSAIRSADGISIDNNESMFENMYRNWFDDISPIEKLVSEAKKLGVKVKAGQDANLLAKQYRKINAMIQTNLERNTYYIDENGTAIITGKGLKPILDDFDNVLLSNEADLKVRHSDLKDYLVARRYLEDLVDMEDVNVTEEQKISSVEVMANLNKKYGENLKWFDTFSNEIYDYQRRILKNFVLEGNMSQERYDEIINKHKNYIPFQRVLEETGYVSNITPSGVFTRAGATKVIKKIEGSDKEVKDPIQQIIKNTANIIDLSYRNRVAKSIANMSHYMPEYIQRVESSGKDTMRVYRDGEVENYKVSKPLLEAIEGLPPEVSAGFSKALQILSGAPLLRAGATIIPEFWGRNIVRDQWTALIQSESRPIPFIDMAKGMLSYIGKDAYYQEWMQGGGPFSSYMDLSDKGLEDSYKELFREEGKLAKYVRNPLKVLEDTSMLFEQGTRLGVFIKSKQAGMSSLEAANEANESTLDFSRGGRLSRKVNKYAAFFNARLQGIDKMIRVFKTNPKAASAYATATITIPQIILTGYYLYGAPEEERKEYLEIPQWQKDLFWVAKINGVWLRVPRPFTLGFVFGSVPERLMTWMYQGDKPEGKDMWLDILKGVAEGFSPVYEEEALLPPTIKTMFELSSNYSFFTDREIYPEWLDSLDPEYRSKKYGSETGKEIGKAIGVSPAKIDYAVRGLMAGSGTYVLDASDKILNAVKEWNGETIAEKPVTLADKAIVRAFVVRDPVGYRANSTANFFDNLKEASQAEKTFKMLEGEEKAKYFEEKSNLIGIAKPMQKFSNRISKLSKVADSIFDDKDMTSEEKIKEINVIEAEVLEIAKDANNMFAEAIKK